MNKQEFVEYVLGGVDFDLVTHYVLNHWDTKHKDELLHCLIDQLQDKRKDYDCDKDDDKDDSCGCEL